MNGILIPVDPATPMSVADPARRPERTAATLLDATATGFIRCASDWCLVTDADAEDKGLPRNDRASDLSNHEVFGPAMMAYVYPDGTLGNIDHPNVLLMGVRAGLGRN